MGCQIKKGLPFICIGPTFRFPRSKRIILWYYYFIRAYLRGNLSSNSHYITYIVCIQTKQKQNANRRCIKWFWQSDRTISGSIVDNRNNFHCGPGLTNFVFESQTKLQNSALYEWLAELHFRASWFSTGPKLHRAAPWTL